MPKLSDQELIERCCARDTGAWSLLIERYGRLVTWAVRRELGRFGPNADEAEDLFQMIWSRMWDKGLLQKVKDPGALSSWLVCVAVNEVRTYIRKSTGRGRGAQVSLEDSGILETLRSGLSSRPDRDVLTRELGDVLTRSFDCLSARDRLVLRLFFAEGIKARRIADSLGMPINTILSVISRARKKVADTLRDKGIEPR